MSDLDDFFAKKDRKKLKNTKKYATTEEVARKLEDTSKKTDKTKKERLVEGEETSTPPNEQDEWKDFEEEKKDYSGLKIGNLTISSNSDGNPSNVESNAEQQPAYDDSGNEVDKKIGPWKKVNVDVNLENDNEKTAEPIQQQLPHHQQQQQQQQQPSAPQQGVYISPALRNQQSQPVQPNRLRSKAAPDIHNEEYFPTLSGSKSSDRKNRSEGTFEVVSHNKSSSYRHAEQTKLASGQGPKLTLGNRYNTLSNDS